MLLTIFVVAVVETEVSLSWLRAITRAKAKTPSVINDNITFLPVSRPTVPFLLSLSFSMNYSPPFRINNKVHKESIVSPVFSFYDNRRENLDWIEDVSIIGEIKNQDGSETRTLEITKDTVTP